VILAAELVYHELVCKGATFAPGWHKTFAWTPPDGAGASWDVKAEVLPNAVWRRGRLFFRCPRCEQRVTRLYIPLAGLEPRCRRCWGLSYESQSWSYNASGGLGSLFGPVAYVTTLCRREERQRAARARYDARRAFL
jgi:hypothetical protein